MFTIFRHRRKNLRPMLIAAGMVCAAYMCRTTAFDGTVYERILGYTRSILYMLLFFFWAVSLERRIIQVRTRKYLVSIAMLMLLWIILRTIKFDLVHDPYIIHWLWYLYYVPILFIPLFSLYVSMSICRGDDFQISGKLKQLYLPAGILLMLVLTNDLHHLVFTFPADGPKYPMNGYGYGPAYYMIIVWIAVCSFAALICIFVRNRMNDKRKRILIPALILGGILFYGFHYAMRISFIYRWFTDMTVVFCLFTMVVFESMLQLNLIQSNSQYRELFRCSSIPVVIVDQDYREQISSRAYTEIDAAVIRQSEAGPVVMPNGIRLSSAPIRIGHVLWQEDTSELVKLNRQLESTRLSMEEQNAAEMEACQAEYQRRQLEEKNRLYDKMQKETRSRVALLSELIDQLEAAAELEEERRLLRQISVIGAYIKRRNNLVFLSEDWKEFPARELKNCIKQSLDSLTLFGVEAEQEFQLVNDIRIEETIRMYEIFEEAVECSLDTLSDLLLVIKEDKRSIRMTLRLCSGADLAALQMEGLTVQEEDRGEWLLSYTIEKEEEPE